MNCDREEKVSLLIDGELTAAEVHELENHLLECDSCQALRADFLSLRRQITDYTPTFDPASQQEVLTKILRGGRQPIAVVPQRRRFAFEWSFGRAALAFASLLLIAMAIGIAVYRDVLLKKAPEVTAKSGQPEVKAPVPAPPGGVKPHDKQLTQNSTIGAPRPPTSNSSSQPGTRRRIEPVTSSANVAAARRPVAPVDNIPPVRSADAETLTAMHFEKSELLLRGFRNVRLDEPGQIAEVDYERSKAKQLVYQNMMLRREADAAGDIQVASLLESLEPILIDIANLPDKPADDDIRVIKERVERKNIVALLQVNSAALARALD